MLKRKKQEKKQKYYRAVGRRKTATATVRLDQGKGQITINKKKVSEYFENPEEALKIFLEPLQISGKPAQFDIFINVKGGGKKAQIEAIRLAISRALLLSDSELRPTLKKAGFLTRDSRAKERKKPGLKRARRAPQWQKR